MSSIPLPALNVQAPQQQGNPLDSYGKMLQIKNMMQQQQMQPGQLQLQQQQIQSGQQENQMRQLQLQDQTSLRSSAKNLDWTDPSAFDKWIQNAQQSGVSPQTLSQLSLQRAQYKEQLAKTDTATLAADQTRNSQLLGHIDAIQQTSDPVKRATVAQQQAQQILTNGLVKDPNQQQAMTAIAQGQHVPTDDELTNLKIGLTDHNTQVEQALKSQQTAEAAAKAGQAGAEQKKAEADTVKTNLENNAIQQFGGMTPNMQESKYLFLQTKKNQGQSIQPADQAFVKAYEKNKTLNTQVQFNLQNGGATGTAGKPSALAQALASGDMKWTDFVTARTPMSVKQDVLAQVKAINPSYNSGDFTVEQKAKEAFTSGGYSQQLNAINTAREHMKTFGSLADALSNNDTQALNKVGNAIGVQFGSDKATNFQIAAQAFGGEVGKAFDGAGVTQGEREAAMKGFSPNMSPAQLKGAVQTVDRLLSGKQSALQQTYNQSQHAQPNFGGQNSSSSGGSAISVTAPNGKIYSFPDQVSANAFKQKAGIQ